MAIRRTLIGTSGALDSFEEFRVVLRCHQDRQGDLSVEVQALEEEQVLREEREVSLAARLSPQHRLRVRKPQAAIS